MRLIDVDAFKRQIAGMTIANSYSVNKANALCELIDAQPIAFDLDKVVEQLKDEQELSYADFEIYAEEHGLSEDDDWEKQIDIVAYYGSITVGSIVYCGKEIGWQSVIDGHMDFMQAESLEDAKKEMIDILDEHFTDQINYYHDLQDSLEELNDREV